MATRTVLFLCDTQTIAPSYPTTMASTCHLPDEFLLNASAEVEHLVTDGELVLGRSCLAESCARQAAMVSRHGLRSVCGREVDVAMERGVVSGALVEQGAIGVAGQLIWEPHAAPKH